MVKIVYNKYAKAYIEQVATNTTQNNSEDRTQLIGLLNYFEVFFDGNLGEWDT